jgi:hypothetical protein
VIIKFKKIKKIESFKTCIKNVVYNGPFYSRGPRVFHAYSTRGPRVVQVLKTRNKRLKKSLGVI